ncbi:MAG: sulfatase [Pseudomonadota bacterium]
MSEKMRLGRIFALIVVLTGCGGTKESELAERLPDSKGMNVLIISFDALRVDALGVYGGSRGLSPNIDRFSEQSIVFENAYTAAPVTPTSFAAAFTGQWPFQVFHGWKLVVQKTLAEILQENGYHTWGIFNNPQLATERFFNRGFDNYQVVYEEDKQVLEDAVAILNGDLPEPFFGWVHFISPHSPYDYRELATHLYDPDYEGPYERTSGQPVTADNPQDLKRLRDLYDGEVLFLDALFAELMETLRSRGLVENTVIIVTSDHGEEFMEHGQLEHNAVFEELIHIPMMIRHPKGSGWRNPTYYSNVDLLPTLTSALGIKPGEIRLDGVDLMLAASEQRTLLSTGMTHKFDRHFSAATGPEKLIVDCKPEYAEALYDLGADPAEQANRIKDDPNRATALLDLAKLLATDEPCTMIARAIANQNPTANLTEEQIENLRSLGYIQ